jgi:hypothetical protein
LTPASGRQDHTTSPSALAPFVKSAAASTASRTQRTVTIAMRPSCEAGCVDDGGDLGWRQSEIFFRRGLDSKIPSWPVGQINNPREPADVPIAVDERRSKKFLKWGRIGESDRS